LRSDEQLNSWRPSLTHYEENKQKQDHIFPCQ